MRNVIGRNGTVAGPLWWKLGAAAACLVLAGCLAQKAELNKVESNLNDKIQALDKQEKEIDRLINETRAKLANEIRDMREEELPKFQGKLDETLYQLNTLAGRMDDRAVKLEKMLNEQTAARTADRQHLQDELGKVNATIVSMAKTVDGRLQEHDKAIASGEALHKRTAQQLEAQNKALSALGERIVQQDQRTDALTQKIEADAKTTSTHLTEVNKSIASIAKTVEAVGGKFQAKLQEQDRRLEETVKGISLLQNYVQQQDRRLEETVKGISLLQNYIQQQHRRLEEQAEGIAQLHTQIAELSKAVQELRVAKEHAPSKKGPKQGKRPAESAPEPHLVPPAEQPPPADNPPQQGTGGPTGPSEPAVAAAVIETPPADHEANDKQVYEQSLQQFKQGNLDGALQGFSVFLTQHPASSLASNAQYWIGECYYGKKDFERAIEAYDRVQGSYPTSEKVPAALLKKAFAYLSKKDRKRASTTLRQVMDAYPSSPEAGKASEKLAQLKLQ